MGVLVCVLVTGCDIIRVSSTEINAPPFHEGGFQKLKGETMTNVHPDWWPVLVAFAFAACLALRGIDSMFTDKTVEGAPPGYVRTDYRGSIAASIGAVIVFAMAWVAPWFVEAFFVKFLKFDQEGLLGVIGFAHASVSVILVLMGVYVKHLAKDWMDRFYSGDGERTTRSVVYTVAGAVCGCIAASAFAVA